MLVVAQFVKKFFNFIKFSDKLVLKIPLFEPLLVQINLVNIF
jgi:hypothetical protein